MKKKIVLVIVFGIVLGVLYWLTSPFFITPQVHQIEKTREVQKQEKENLIRVENIAQGQVVVSPLVIKGEARVYLFFVASFALRIYDDVGNELGVAIAQAKDEWMTENFVPFEATLQFKTPGTKQGILVLEKDNPSGLPEHADELRIPIVFK